MNNAGPKHVQNNFDFSRPPPGYVRAASSAAKYASLNKVTTASNDKKEPSPTLESRFTYYPTACENMDGHKSTLSSQSQDPSLGSQYRNNLHNQALNTPIDPRIYSLPPPPPPTDPYPSNMAVPPGQFVFNPAIYAAYAVPPPIPGSLTAGHYVHQPQIYRHQQYQRDYNTGYSNRTSYYSHNIRKRKGPQETEADTPKKTPRKKKKPLSQNIPSRKDWSVEDARRALEVEKEFNKRHKSQHLIIKFPDLELNRDIVSKFHSKIDSVHFQQPSTPRFCFVTLKESANMEEVINELNNIKFGDGYLTAEPKKDREEDFNIGPEDIDPLNLYVGNLAQEVTVDDVVKAYPKNKRIDIGFAKKMKFTRYAFVCFRTVDDAIEAFQNTHATEMYSKSLIVRFRRLHGTVGLPGEPKPQNHQKRSEVPNSLSELIENPANSTQDGNASFVSNGPIKKEKPASFSYSYGSDDEEDDEEYLHYSNNIQNLIVNAINTDVIANIKNEPLDYDSEKYFQSYDSYEPIDEKPHVPKLEVKTEPDVKPKVKVEKEHWKENDEGFDPGDHNDPFYGAFARASKFKI